MIGKTIQKQIKNNNIKETNMAIEPKILQDWLNKLFIVQVKGESVMPLAYVMQEIGTLLASEVRSNGQS